MKKTFVSAAMMAALCFTSCSEAGKTVSLAGEWKIVSVEGQQVTSDDPFLGFDMNEGRMYGNAGCNSLMASVSVDTLKNTLTLSEVGATRKMCPDMKLEEQVLAALQKVAGYQASNEGVELTDAQGKVVFLLEKNVAPAVSVNDLDGEWFITSVEGKKVEKVEKTPFVAFDVKAGKVHGTAGCNIFNGDFSQEKGKAASFKFGELATTMMAGPGMEQESVILAAMGKVRGFDKKGNTIVLLDENQKEVVVLTKNTGKSLAE